MHIVIVGSGVAGINFAEKLRHLAGDVQISLITKESAGYYSRPLLSRGFSKKDIEQSIILKPFEKLREEQLTIFTNTEVTAIDRLDQRLTLSQQGQEQSLSYDKLILAQGSAAFIPPPYREFANYFYCFNSLDDLKILRKKRQQIIDQQRKVHWAIIGGGLIGCEVASDLAVSGDRVTLYHVMDRLMERKLVPEDSLLLLSVLQKSGVDVRLNQHIQKIFPQENQVVIQTEQACVFDMVIVACGFKPRIELAQQAKLAVGRGIQVNDYLQTTDPAIFALGDVAELPNQETYAFIMPIRSQANWLAGYLTGIEQQAWTPPEFSTKAKVHGFEALHPYLL